MTQPFLELRNVRLEIPQKDRVVRAVRGVSFALTKGDSMGIVGESGSGKSMLLRSIPGLVPRGARITDGQVLLEGEDLLTASPERLREIRGNTVSMVFQEPMTALNPVMRIGKQVMEGPAQRLGLSRAAAQRRAIELLEMVGIPEPERRADAYPHELSGGMRQRVVIAMAISSEPSLLLCDEPTTALDVSVQKEILELLKGLQEELGLTLVFVSHDLAVVGETCNQLGVMYAGELVETGTTAEIFAQPRHPYTRGLLKSLPDLTTERGSLQAIAGMPPDLTVTPVGCPFLPRCPYSISACHQGAFPIRRTVDGRHTACIRNDAWWTE